jgi:phytoene dehydrogenase-like protein
MGAVSAARRDAALAAGAHVRTGAEVTAVGDGEVRFRTAQGGESSTGARWTLANVAVPELDRLRGRAASHPSAEGSQLKVNLLLARLPRLREAQMSTARAFAGTFHVNETASSSTRPIETRPAGGSPHWRRARRTATR